MSQTATQQTLEPEPGPPVGGTSPWKIGLGIVIGFVGIVGLIVLFALYQIVSDSVTEVRSAGPLVTKTVRVDTTCAATPDALRSGTGEAVRLYAGDTVKPQMATGEFTNVVPASGVAAGKMTDGCWTYRSALE